MKAALGGFLHHGLELVHDGAAGQVFGGALHLIALHGGSIAGRDGDFVVGFHIGFGDLHEHVGHGQPAVGQNLLEGHGNGVGGVVPAGGNVPDALVVKELLYLFGNGFHGWFLL